MDMDDYELLESKIDQCAPLAQFKSLKMSMPSYAKNTAINRIDMQLDELKKMAEVSHPSIDHQHLYRTDSPSKALIIGLRRYIPL